MVGMNLFNPDRVAKILNAQLMEIDPEENLWYLPGHRTLRFDNGVQVLALGFSATVDRTTKVFAEVETNLTHRSEWYNVEEIRGDVIVPGWDLLFECPFDYTVFWEADVADEQEAEA